MITHITTDHTHTADNGKRSGQVRHAFHSPTHWSTICEVVEDYNPYRAKREITLSYGAGGWNTGYTDGQIALAVSLAFTQAAVLLAGLEHSTQEA
jgi:hypothetical protein